jgi:hypothetical protein
METDGDSRAVKLWLSRMRHKAKTSQLRCCQRGDREAFRMVGLNLILEIRRYHLVDTLIIDSLRTKIQNILDDSMKLSWTFGAPMAPQLSGPECRISHDDPHNFPRRTSFFGYQLIAKLSVARRLAGPSLPPLLTRNETRISVC